MAFSPKGETRIFFPKSPSADLRPWVNKPVTVDGWHVFFSKVGKIHGADVHEARYFGHVKELDMQIPEDELLKPGQPLKGPTNV